MTKPLSNRAWIEPEPLPADPLNGSDSALHPIAAQILARRGYADPAAARAFLDPAHYRPAPAADLPGIEAAVSLITAALQHGRLIAVWGDYDVDGQTAVALLVGTLRELGGQVIWHLPVRAHESHGVNIDHLTPLLDQGAALLLTCDTGIASHAAVEYAQARGVPVIVTDHHDLPAILPAASVVVNPKLLGPDHPLSALPGVGVAYKLAQALFAQAGRPEGADAYLDLVALGIVADVADLRGDNRYLLQRGLQLLRAHPRPALAAMLQQGGLDQATLTESQIGYTLGPMLNAIGRLADANPIVDFLSATDINSARSVAADLAILNAERKRLTAQVYDSALAMLAADPDLRDAPALVLAHPDWPAGILGIVAARLVDRFGKPALLLTTPPDGLARGSARSVPGCDITAALQARAELLAQYGGHAQAAGLAIQAERLPELRQALGRAVAEQLGHDPEPAPLLIDACVSLAEVTLPLVDGLERLGPFGPGNLVPVLAAQGVTLQNYRRMGQNGEHLALFVADATGSRLKVMLWNGVSERLPKGRFDLAFTVRATIYRGEREIQAVGTAFRPAGIMPETQR